MNLIYFIINNLINILDNFIFSKKFNLQIENFKYFKRINF